MRRSNAGKQRNASGDSSDDEEYQQFSDNGASDSSYQESSSRYRKQQNIKARNTRRRHTTARYDPGYADDTTMYSQGAQVIPEGARLGGQLGPQMGTQMGTQLGGQMRLPEGTQLGLPEGSQMGIPQGALEVAPDGSIQLPSQVVSGVQGPPLNYDKDSSTRNRYQQTDYQSVQQPYDYSSYDPSTYGGYQGYMYPPHMTYYGGYPPPESQDKLWEKYNNSESENQRYPTNIPPVQSGIQQSPVRPPVPSPQWDSRVSRGPRVSTSGDRESAENPHVQRLATAVQQQDKQKLMTPENIAAFPSLVHQFFNYPNGVGQRLPETAAPNYNVSTALWEEEKTLCLVVGNEGKNVSRRCDNNMINGTKLLNASGLSRGKRDGLLKGEKVRHVVKIGNMDFKGVWIPYERALHFAQLEGQVDKLFPLFLADLHPILYSIQNRSRLLQLLKKGKDPSFDQWLKGIPNSPFPYPLDHESPSSEKAKDPSDYSPGTSATSSEGLTGGAVRSRGHTRKTTGTASTARSTGAHGGVPTGTGGRIIELESSPRRHPRRLDSETQVLSPHTQTQERVITQPRIQSHAPHSPYTQGRQIRRPQYPSKEALNLERPSSRLSYATDLERRRRKRLSSNYHAEPETHAEQAAKRRQSARAQEPPSTENPHTDQGNPHRSE